MDIEEIVVGRSWTFDLIVYDNYVSEDSPDNVPTNLTDWTVRSEIRTKVGNQLIFDLTPTIPVPTSGAVQIRKTRGDTLPLTPNRNLWWDMVLTSPAGADVSIIDPEGIIISIHPTQVSNA